MPRRRVPLRVADDRAALQPGSPWWAYCRVSLGERQDIASQRRAVQEFADKHQLSISRWWVDDHVSGSSVEGRDAFEQMIETARADGRGVAGILVWSFSRLARNEIDAQYFKSDLRRRGFAIVSVSEDVPADVSSIVEVIYDFTNRKYLENLSKDTKRGLRDTVLRQQEVDGVKRTGFSGGGFPPRGYRARYVETGQRKNGAPRINALWEVDPEWQVRVAKARAMFAGGAKLADIQRECHIFNCLQSYAPFWANETYAGVRFCGDVRVEHAHEAYDDAAQRAAILARLRQSADRSNPRPHSKHKHLLSGIAYCGYCGATMHGNAHRGGSYYYCSHSRSRRSHGGTADCNAPRILCATLDSAVVQAFRERILTVEALRNLVDAINAKLAAEHDPADDERSKLEHDAKRLRKEIAHLVDFIRRGKASDAIADALANSEADLRLVDAQLAALAGQPAAKQMTASDAALAAMAEQMARDLADARAEAVAAIIRSVIHRVDVWAEQARFQYNPSALFHGQDCWLVNYPQRGSVVTSEIRVELMRGWQVRKWKQAGVDLAASP